jgi:hypothetical protein
MINEDLKATDLSDRRNLQVNQSISTASPYMQSQGEPACYDQGRLSECQINRPKDSYSRYFKQRAGQLTLNSSRQNIQEAQNVKTTQNGVHLSS